MLRRSKPNIGSAPVLYLVGTPIGNMSDISKRAIEVLSTVDIVACEDTRNTGLLLSNLGIRAKKLVSCYAQKEKEEGLKLIQEMVDNNLSIAFVSDAGNPGISDPGALLCSLAIERDIAVSAILGPSAFVQALITSGFDTADFSFYGFPPVKENARKEMFKELKDRRETLVFYESPHRILKTLTAMKEVFGPERRVSVSRELTKMHEEYLRGTLSELSDFPEDALRGEFVIVIEGNQDKEVLSEEVVKAKLEEYLEKGYSPKEAISYVVDELGVKKNYAYKLLKDRL